MAGIACASVLFYFSFPNIFFLGGAPLLAWGCLVPLFCVLEAGSFGARAFIGLAWGLLSYGALVSWLWPVTPGGWALFVLALAWQGALFGALFPSSVVPATTRLFLVPSAWVVSEWARSLALEGFTWSLGYAPGMTPALIQPAAFGGVHAVGWAIVLVNTAFYLAWRSRLRRVRFLLWGVAAFLACWLAGEARLVPSHEAGRNTRVAVIQPNILRDEKVRADLYDVNAARHLALMKKVVVAGRPGPGDLVAWPETAFVDDVLTDMKWRPRLETAARNFRTNILIGSALLQEGRDLNSALLLSPEGEWRSVYHKQRLVPFAEFTPVLAAALARGLKIGKYHFTAGTQPGAMVLAGGARFGAVICSEEFYPLLLRRTAAGGPEFVVTMLNDGWFARREALFLHALAAPLRAVETGVPVIRAANTGRTMAVDAFGRMIGRPLDVGQPGMAVYDIPSGAHQTFYARWGDVFACACLVFVIIMIMIVHHQQVRREGAA